jgi:hypothetical protein
MNDKNGKRSAFSRFEIGTLATLAPALLILLLLVKVYGVARFSLTTATALATAAPLSVFIGTLALYQYASMAIVAASSLLLSIAWYWNLYPSAGASHSFFAVPARVTFRCRIRSASHTLFRRTRFTLLHPLKQGMIALAQFKALLRGRGRLRHLVPLTVLLMLFSVLLTPPYYLIRASIASAAVLILWSFLRRKVSLPALAAYAAVVALVISLILTLETPWVPAEVVSLKHPIFVGLSSKHKVMMSQYPVAFIVSDDNGWTAMLVNENRYLTWVRDSDITSRKICHLAGQLGSGQVVYLVLRGQPYTSPNVGCPIR